LQPIYSGVILPEWIDYNGHMNDAWYAFIFSRALERLMAQIGFELEGRNPDSPTTYTLTATIHYLAEIREGEAFSVDARILAHDAKRLHAWADMRRQDGAIAASTEQIFLCVDQSSGKPRAAPFPPDARARIEQFQAERAHEPMPARMGQGISLDRRPGAGA
jgi:acyl-CoA thioester hydrolase